MSLIDLHYTEFGVTATYTPSGGSGVSVTVCVDDQSYDRDDMQRTSGARRTETTIWVRVSEVATRPTPGATFMITNSEGNNETWTIIADGVKDQEEIKDFGAEWGCMCERGVRPVI